MGVWQFSLTPSSNGHILHLRILWACAVFPVLLAHQALAPYCYGKNFFHYFDEKPDKLDVLYLSDSNHNWKFGYPLDFDFSKVDNLQLLTHPYSWTENGGDNYGNFLSLIRERNTELLYSMDTETNTFPKELLQ